MKIRGNIPEKLMYICAKQMTLRDGGAGLNADIHKLFWNITSYFHRIILS
jgi:hypothetical protein